MGLNDKLKEVEKLKRFFSVYDDNFFTGMKKLFIGVSEILRSYNGVNYCEQSDSIFKEIFEQRSKNEGVSRSDTIGLTVEFFEMLNSKYQEIVVNLLQDYLIENGDINHSSSARMFLSGNYYDVITLCHELTHKFVTGSELENDYDNFRNFGEWKFSPYGTILSEIDSIVIEFLACDFIYLKTGKDLFMPNTLFRLLVVDSASKKVIGMDKDIKIASIFKKVDTREAFEEFYAMTSEFPTNAERYYTQKMRWYSHTFGTVVACYIYQQILDNPQKFDMFLGVEKAMGTVDNTGTLFSYLEQLGLPIVKDGKLSLDDDSVGVMLLSVKKTLDKAHNVSETNKTGLFNREPMMNSELINQTSNLFLQVESRKK